MAFDADKVYYKLALPGDNIREYTPREISKAPTGKIDIMYQDADGYTNGELGVKVIWVDDIALYLERRPEDDFMVPWHSVFSIELR